MPKTILSDGVAIHYQRVGAGPDVVMVHGITGNLAVWHLRIVPALSERFRVLTYDLRGHGYSDTPASGYSPDAMAGDLLELVDALEIERPTVVGHSYGADVALYFAACNPDRARQVVAIEPALPALEEIRADDGWIGWSHWAEALENAGHRVPPERRSDIRYLLQATIELPKQWGPLRGLPRNPRPFLRLLEETSLPEDYRRVGTLTLDRIAEIETPVVLMCSEQSAFAGTFEHLRDSLPNVDPILLPRTEWGHFGPLEQPELVAEHIAARLDATDEMEEVGDRCTE